MRCKKEIPY